MAIDDIIGVIDTFVWGPVLVWFCLICGLIFSLAMKFVQIRLFKEMIKCSFGGNKSETGMTGFQALNIAIGGRVGTGNITGTASAILFGGPGAIFWMWVMSIICASSAYIESALAQIWKQKAGNEYVGGPSFYMEKGLKAKPVGMFYAIFSIIFLIIFAGLQSNAFSSVASLSFNIPSIVTAVAYTVLLSAVVFGGAKQIARVAEKAVPFMSLLYVAVAIIMLIVNFKQVPSMLAMIVGSALNMNALFGGLVGSAVSWGVKRGIFSNEAGLGTGAWVAGCTDVSHPAKAGLSQAFSVFISLLICTATALMILCSGRYNVLSPDGSFLVSNVVGDSSQFTAMAVDSLISGGGAVFIAIAMFFFTFTTVMAYSVYLNCINRYLFKSDIDGVRAKKSMMYINLATVIMAFAGPLISSATIWNLASAMCGIISIVNVGSLVLLYKPGVATLKDYERQIKKGIDPVFIPENCGITNADIWNEIIRRDYADELAAYQKAFPNDKC
ncbi:alanine:cation symporter family protein [Tissierella carlieri]|uniref:alanine/glycine:cation symporter family protein n=1 Tax=Tissierella carlieri TaxID=689904 RepID=UPI001C116970|nr:alanine/glycine:cation symporter family protein [Tissierella carlieri]MBU5310986.1 alanine:cation symporter family protein [Tissierella carlieri]